MGFAAVGWVSYQSTKPSPPVNLVGDLAYAQSLLPTPTPGQPSLESKWRYDTETDEMTGKSEKSASVVSGNSFEFGFPYRGVQHAELTLRDHPRYGKNVILSIERGQFMAGVLGCAVTVRFDDQAPQKYWARGAADNSTETIFLNNYSKFVTSTRKSRTLRLSTEVYHEGSPVFEFNISGLKDF